MFITVKIISDKLKLKIYATIGGNLECEALFWQYECITIHIPELLADKYINMWLYVNLRKGCKYILTCLSSSMNFLRHAKHLSMPKLTSFCTKALTGNKWW